MSRVKACEALVEEQDSYYYISGQLRYFFGYIFAKDRPSSGLSYFLIGIETEETLFAKATNPGSMNTSRDRIQDGKTYEQKLKAYADMQADVRAEEQQKK